MRKKKVPVSFFDHLTELRSRFLQCLLGFVLGSCIFYSFIDAVLDFILKPVGTVIFTSPSDAFVARMTLTLIGGFFLSLPLIIYHIWKFIALGLREKEIRYVVIYGPLSLFCFILGAVFSYFVLLPTSLKFLLGFATKNVLPMITVEKYISFVGTMVVAGGVTFELPLIIAFLARIGIATPEFLRQKRRYAIVIIFIVSAIITPPDAASQLIMAVPLLVLYEAGIIMAKMVSPPLAKANH